MSTYTYKCDDCSLTNDFQFPLGEAPETFVLSERAVHTFRRVITAPAVVVAGGTKAGFVKR